MRHLMIVSALFVCFGCNRLPNLDKPRKEPADKAAQKPAKDQKPPDPESVIGKTTAEIVDAEEALKDPNIRQLGKRKIPIADPITQATSAYFILSARVSKMGLQRSIQLYQAQYDKFPTHQELKKMMKDNGVRLAKLRPYEMYGYEQKTGDIVILEDRKKKAELYEGLGLELDEE